MTGEFKSPCCLNIFILVLQIYTQGNLNTHKTATQLSGCQSVKFSGLNKTAVYGILWMLLHRDNALFITGPVMACDDNSNQ